MQRRIEVVADQDGLIALLQFNDEAEQLLRLSDEQRYVMRLAIEEIATNIIKYAYPAAQPGPLCVECAADAGALRVTIADRGMPFDPRAAPAPDLSTDITQRAVGGLGLYLVRELADDLSYQHDPASGWNVLTIMKRAEADHA